MIVTFRDYQLNSVYQIDLKLLNRKQLLTSFKYIPPLTENFSVKKIIYPKKDTSLIAPGMSVKMEILFNATSLNSFNDELTIITETFAFKIPLRAIRDSPALSLDNPMDCKKCLIGDQVSMVFRCKNNGGDAHFKFLPHDHYLEGLERNDSSINNYNNYNLISSDSQRDNNNNANTLNNNYMTHYSQNNDNEILELGPFSIFPSEFYLYRGMMIEIFVNFSPKFEGIIEKNFIISCDSKINLDYKIRGDGILIDMKLVSLDGLKIDESIEKLENLFFDDTYPSTTSTRQLKILNKSSVPVKFHWILYDFYSPNKFSIEEENKYFEILPEEGVFQPGGEINFTLKFNPKNSKIYEQKLDMVIEDIPFQAIKQYNPTSNFSTIRQRNHFTKGEPFLLSANSPYPSYPLFSFNLKGKGKLPFLEVDNNFINIGDVYIGQKITKTFSIFNPKTGIINFKLSKLIQVIHYPQKIHKKVNNYFTNDKNFIHDSLFLNKKSDINLSKMSRKLFSSKNLINQILDNVNVLHTEPEEKENYDKENYIKIFTNSHYLNQKKQNSNISNKSKKIPTARSYLFKGFKKSIKNKENKEIQEKNITDRNRNTDRTNNSIINLNNSLTPPIPLSHSQSQTQLQFDTEIEEDTLMFIEKDQKIDFNINFIPKSLGLFKASLIFTPEDGTPFSIDLKASIKGPKIKLDTPCLDFGLFQISEIKTLKFKIINISPIPATFLIKQSRFKNINFFNFVDENYKEEVEGIITEKQYRKKIESLTDYNNRNMIKYDYKKFDLYSLKFSNIHGTINPKEEKEIIVSFTSPYPKKLEDTIEIMIENSESYYMNIHADCQEAYGYLDITIIQPKDIYVSVPIKYNNNIIKLYNPSNLPITFKWEELYKQDEINVTFTPNKGIVKPRSFQEIKFSAIYNSIKEVNDLFKCYIEEMEVPLGVIIKGKVTGLDILYEISEDSLVQLMSSKMTENLSISSVNSKISKNSHSHLNTSRRRNYLLSGKDEKLDKALKSIELKNVKVNKPYYFSFTMKNCSGIVTYYNIYTKNYQPGGEKLNNDIGFPGSFDNSNNNTHNNNTHNNSNNNTMNKLTTSKLSTNKFSSTKYKNTSNKLDHMILSDTHEEINFTSPKGLEFSKMRQIEKDSILYLTNKKGVAIVIDPKNGRLEPHSEVLITISIYNECVGDFEDELICEVKGLPPKIIPINLKIRGNPLQLSPFQPGINYDSNPPLMYLGSVLTKVNKIEKMFKLLNTGSNLLSVEWKVYDYNDILYPKRNIFDIKISENKNRSYSLIFNPVEPEEFPEDKKYFEIYPKSCVINPKAVRDFIITFNTPNQGLSSALIVGYPKFESHISNVKLSELAIKVDALGVTPKLVVDKNLNFNNQYVYKFNYHSEGISPNAKRSIVLINKEKINLIIKVELYGPFKIIKTEPMESTIGNMEFNIIPNSNLKLEIKFLFPNVNDENEWPMTLVNEKEGKLKIIFENGDISEYYLKAILRRPRIKLSTTGNESIEGPNFINFGLVNCESYRKHSLFLTNETEVETKWTINYVKFVPKKSYGYGTTTKEEKEDIEKTDDPDVFHFSITQGVICGPSNQLINIPIGPGLPEVYNKMSEKFNPVKIEVMFRPKKNVFYKSRYRIISETGNQIDFILKGNGSYLEEHI